MAVLKVFKQGQIAAHDTKKIKFTNPFFKEIGSCQLPNKSTSTKKRCQV